MKIVFFGSDDFAAASFMSLWESSHEIVAGVTQPDRKRGRGMKVQYSLLKELMVERHLPILQPANIREPEFVKQLSLYDADLFVVVAYGQILSQDILDVPKYFCINLHGSLLPQYRGAAPLNWAIINGDEKTGVTVQKMVRKMDAGDIISQREVPLVAQDAGQLRAELAKIGAALLVDTVDDIAKGQYTLTSQDESKVTYASKLDKTLGLIDWSRDASYLARLVRGLAPWPGTFTFITGLRLKILEAEAVESDTRGVQPGTLIEQRKNAFVVAAGKGALLVKEVHLESSRPANAGVFLSSYTLPEGFRLG